MVKLSRIVRDYADAGGVNTLLAPWGFVQDGIFLTKGGDVGLAYDEWIAVAPALSRIGGSNAQRELFGLMLIEAALATGHAETARRLVAERQRLRPHDPWLAARSGSIA